MNNFLSIMLWFLIVLSACNSSKAPLLGTDEKDAVVLAQEPALQSIAEGIEDHSITLEEWIRDENTIPFKHRPQPEVWMTTQWEHNQQNNVVNGQPLKILTLNVALLDIYFFGMFSVHKTPYWAERKGLLAARFLQDNDDIIVVQELWNNDVVELFKEDAAAAGYLSLVSDRSLGSNGLAMFVKANRLQGGTQPKVETVFYEQQEGYEWWPGPGVRRAFMRVEMQLKDIGKTVVYNTHMQSGHEVWHKRILQARQLGIHVRTMTNPDDVVVVAGDMNSGPYYTSEKWVRPNGLTIENWYHNTTAYGALLTYGELMDAFIMGRPQERIFDDVVWGDKMVDSNLSDNDNLNAWLDEICTREHKEIFTGTRCNKISYQQYGLGEFPARIDHVHITARNDRIKVLHSEVVYQEKESFEDVHCEPSDHYGVRVELTVQ